MKNIQKLCIVVFFTAFVISGCKKTSSDDLIGTKSPTVPSAVVTTPPAVVPVGPIGDNDHMLMGNLSNAAGIPDSLDNYLFRKPYYALSYNSTRGEPNWVSWHLFAADISGAPRQDDYREDPDLLYGWFRVQADSYNGSGFDRGHNCPSGDRTSTIPANSSTFLMSNFIPQAPNNNQQTWENMETYIRAQLGSTKEAYVIMGSYGTGGTGTNGFVSTVAGGHVAVPAFIWKVVVLLDNGNNDISRIDANTRVFSVITPNSNTINSNWKIYRTSVDNIEAATGYDLLSALPVSIQAIIEARVDNL